MYSLANEPYLQVLQLCLSFWSPTPPQEFQHFRLLQRFLVGAKVIAATNQTKILSTRLQTMCKPSVCLLHMCGPTAEPSSHFCLDVFLPPGSDRLKIHALYYCLGKLYPSFWVHGCEQPPSPIINSFSYLLTATVEVSAPPQVRNQVWP